MNDHYIKAFDKTMKNEGLGKLSNDPRDPGGMTYSGISRRWWPKLKMWKVIDKCLAENKPIPLNDLLPEIKEFYLTNYWNLICGDSLAQMSPALAFEVFDTAVNIGPYDATRLLQQAFNVARGNYQEDLLTDGRLGQKTLKALETYFQLPGGRSANEEILLNSCNGEQYEFYKKNPKRKIFRGWFSRV